MKSWNAWAMAVLFLLPLWGNVALAYDKQGMFMAYGPGNEPCSEFDAIRDRRFGNLTSAQQEQAENTIEYWISGFYTAWNYFSGETFDIIGGMKFDDVLDQMEKYCQRNPQKKLVDAAIVVGHALHMTRSKSAPKSK